MNIMNTDKIWNFNIHNYEHNGSIIDKETKIKGNAINVNGNAKGIYGTISGISGCCSNIIGGLDFIRKITHDLDELHYIKNKYFSKKAKLLMFDCGHESGIRFLHKRNIITFIILKTTRKNIISLLDIYLSDCSFNEDGIMEISEQFAGTREAMYF